MRAYAMNMAWAKDAATAAPSVSCANKNRVISGAAMLAVLIFMLSVLNAVCLINVIIVISVIMIDVYLHIPKKQTEE